MRDVLLITLSLITFVLPQFGHAQEEIPDSTAVSTEPIGIDTTIEYSARVIESTVDNRMTYLIGDAWVRYRNMTLKAAKITVDWNKDLLMAEGMLDTIWISEENPGDSLMKVVYRGLPEFSEGGDVMVGTKMIYNFKTRKGIVTKGRTKLEEGFYFGERIKKVDKEVFNVSNGYFTTCDLQDNPHFHFWSRRMKLILQDKVIAKPIVLYIGKIPVAALPFGIFPNKKGRHSGLIVPRYGESALEGRYFRELGYYFAPSDYWDAKVTVDYFERAGFLFRGDIRYAVRYILQGNLSGSYIRKNLLYGRRQRRWDLKILHRQEINPTMRLMVNGNFVSDGSFYKDLSSNRQQRLLRQLRSNATLSKIWPETDNSLTINLSQTKDLETGQVTEILPQITFRRGRRSIFKPRESKRGRSSWKKALKWYHSIYYSYHSRLINRRFKGWGSHSQQGFGVDHHLNFTGSGRLFGWLALNPSLSYRETWVDRYKHTFLNPESGAIESEEVRRFYIRRVFSSSLSAGTKLYGLFTPGIFGIKAIRHVVTPTLRFSFQPDFSDKKFGYYDIVLDSLGRERKYDKFSGSVFPGTPRGERKMLNFTLQNLFQMKMGEGDKERKFNLFNLDFSAYYNFAADSLKLSNLSSVLRARPTRNLNLLLSTLHSFYKFDRQTGRTVNRWGIPRLVNFYLASSIKLKGRMGEGRKKKQPIAEEEALPEEVEGIGDRFLGEEDFSGLIVPWSLNLSLSYRISKYNPIKPQKTCWLNADLKVNLTKNWSMHYSARFDLINKEIVSHDFAFYRDLHCWELRFVWTPSGRYKQYYLRINVKAPILRELKIEKRGGRAGILGYGE